MNAYPAFDDVEQVSRPRGILAKDDSGVREYVEAAAASHLEMGKAVRSGGDDLLYGDELAGA